MTIDMKDFENRRRLLLALSLKAGGNWDQIALALQNHEYPTVEEIVDAEKKIKCKYITYLDHDYPDNLKYVNKPPLVLYYYGDISLIQHEKESIAVIGSRDASDLGVNITIDFVKRLCGDYVIVSGMAKGIDSVAHITSIHHGGRTIAVLGSGIDYCYPWENLELYKIIKEKGLVISEHPNITPPEQDNFPMRNRIIAGLAKGILITEAKKRSGTLITVNFGQSLSKEIMCVPYPCYEDSGCNQLIKEGAYLVEDADDVRLIMDGTAKMILH